MLRLRIMMVLGILGDFLEYMGMIMVENGSLF